VLERKGIKFVHATADGFDLERRVVIAGDRELPYDRLVVATGPRLAFEKIAGSAPRAASHSRSATSTTQSSWATPGSAISRTRGRSSSAPLRAARASARPIAAGVSVAIGF
jgi:NADPH-dependent 2,4-dienoyl-CoA reductase/sulfur reductase-like enzyme